MLMYCLRALGATDGRLKTARMSKTLVNILVDIYMHGQIYLFFTNRLQSLVYVRVLAAAVIGVCVGVGGGSYKHQQKNIENLKTAFSRV